MTTTLAGALSRLTVSMIEVHERTCEIEGQHRWETCTGTPGIFAVADGLDAIDHGLGLEAVALCLHDRECQVQRCERLNHADSWKDQAEALVQHAHAEADVPLPDEAASRRGELLALCQCGHIRRGHSVDGRRCYHTPCTCQVDGGFREGTAQ